MTYQRKLSAKSAANGKLFCGTQNGIALLSALLGGFPRAMTAEKRHIISTA